MSCVLWAVPTPPPVAHRVACLEIEFCLRIDLGRNYGASFPIFKLQQDGLLFSTPHTTERPVTPRHEDALLVPPSP